MTWSCLCTICILYCAKLLKTFMLQCAPLLHSSLNCVIWQINERQELMIMTMMMMMVMKIFPKYDWIHPKFNWICPKYYWVCPKYGWICPWHDWICPKCDWIRHMGDFTQGGEWPYQIGFFFVLRQIFFLCHFIVEIAQNFLYNLISTSGNCP